MVRGGRAEAPGRRSDVSFRLDQKTGNFKAAIASRVMQWSALTEEKQKNQLAQTEFPFNPIIKICDVVGSTYFVLFAFTFDLLSTKRRQS